MRRRAGEVLFLLGAIALGVALWPRGRPVPELDWSRGQGELRVDGIRLGMSPTEAYAAMGESGGGMMAHVYSSADGRTLFLGGSMAMEVASFDCVLLPDGTKIRAGEDIFRLASLWPLRHRPERKGMMPFSMRITQNGDWYEGAGELWVYADKDGKLEYFDLSKDAESAMGGPIVGPGQE